ncbi:MAG: endonuclease III [Candidatus Tritonobacter lacicola]|nr:endonuclease III [Candidatus Tritonobacter lacicola]
MEKRVKKIITELERAVPEARVELNYSNAFELLIATILSARCTDGRVNEVTGELFKRYGKPEHFLKKKQPALEDAIHSTGFFRNKAKSIMACCRKLEDEFGGEVPRTLPELTGLPGVGRKTANIILGHAFNEQAIPVDTHVKRVAFRLGLTESKKPDVVEEDLRRLVPREKWTDTATRLVLHGRYTCKAKKPLCGECVLAELCPRVGV